jgi:hypothetical protein
MNEEILLLLIEYIDRKIDANIASNNANYYVSEKQYQRTEEIKTELKNLIQ